MSVPRVDPVIEAQRIAALYRYEVLDSPPEVEFDEVVALLAAICQVPMAAISLVDTARQWFKATVGVGLRATPRDVSFCQWTVEQTELLVVEDARTDARFADSPLVTDGPKIRFYAGVPLVTHDGLAIGALCAFDREPRELTSQQHDAMRVLGRHVIGMLEQQRQAKLLREAAVALEEQRRAANVAGEAKSTFLGNMSHELRTPMNGVISATELLLGTNLDAWQRDDVMTIQNCARGLVAILNDVLDVAKIESGSLTIEKQPVELRVLVKDAVAMLRASALAKNISLEAFFDPDVPARVLGDTLRLRQVLVNLVGNALKFTERGCVSIHVRRASRPGAACDLVEITVIDTGIGIPVDKREAIFQKFVQAEASTTRRFSGTGLGLAIVRDLLDAMAGTVRVEDTRGGGSTFIVELPLVECAVEQKPPPPPVVNPVEPRPAARRVLLAEDDTVNRKLMTRLLQRLGCDVEAVENGIAVVMAAEARAFDVILMDIEMPELDGYGATAKIREREKGTGRRTPIIALTAHVLAETRAMCAAAGMDDYLAKPAGVPELVAAFEKWAPPAEAVAA